AAGSELQVKAKSRATTLTEDIASRDLARLMPPGTIAYAELAQPGEALLALLDQLVLIGTLQDVAARKGFAVRPETVRALAGIRGLAVGITRLPEGSGPPGAVAVLHTGEQEILRGLVEAAVLAQGTPADPIEGMPAWTIEERVHVALSARLIVASTEREEIAGVLRRLAHAEEPSLVSQGPLQEELARRGGAPFFCALNAAPLRPKLKALLDEKRKADPRAALLAPALDVESLHSFVARCTLGDDGCAFEASLRLEKDHRN